MNLNHPHLLIIFLLRNIWDSNIADISCALFTLSLSIPILNSQFEEGAKHVNIICLPKVITFLSKWIISKFRVRLFIGIFKPPFVQYDFYSSSEWKPSWAGRNAIMSKKSLSVIYFVNNINLRIKVF